MLFCTKWEVLRIFCRTIIKDGILCILPLISLYMSNTIFQLLIIHCIPISIYSSIQVQHPAFLIFFRLWWQINCAIIPREGSSIDEEEVLRFCKKNLASFKVPKKVFITDSLPKTATGKILRRLVAEHFIAKKWPLQNLRFGLSHVKKGIKMMFVKFALCEIYI